MYLNLRKINYEKCAGWLLVLLGVILRLAQYLSNRNFHIDECNYALMFQWLSFGELFQYEKFCFIHPCPFGFIAVEKLVMVLFGWDEYVLRLFPFLCGISALFVFNKIKGRFLGPSAGLLALALLVVSSPVIYWTSFVRPYSCDILAALLLLWLLCDIHNSSFKLRPSIIFCSTGAAAIWLLFSADFILCAGAIVLIWDYISRRAWGKLRRFSVICLFWGLNLFVCYRLLIEKIIKSGFGHYWAHDFSMEAPVTFLTYAQWLSFHLPGIFRNLLGLELPWLVIFLLCAGCYALYLVDKFRWGLIILPVALTIVAAGMTKYPLPERAILFLAPSFCVLIGAGWEYLYVREKRMFRRGYLAVILLVVLLFAPVKTAIGHLHRPMKDPEIREVVSYVKGNFRTGDGIYVYLMASTPYKYYTREFPGLEKVSYVGTLPGQATGELWAEINKLKKYKRVWVIFGSVRGRDDKLILYCFDQIARRSAVFYAEGSSCYLYEFM